MHAFRVGSIVPDHPGRDALTEVGFECIHAHFDQCLQLGCKPGACFRLGKIDQCHPWLPHIHLVYVAIRFVHQPTACLTFVKQRRGLRNVWVDPQANPHTFILQALQHAGRVREVAFVPQQAGPGQFLHPETIEMHHADRDAGGLHAFQVEEDGLFVIIGGE